MMHALPERWLAIPGDGAIKSDTTTVGRAARSQGVGRSGQSIAVSAISRVIAWGRACTIRVVGVSATSALVSSPVSLGHEGQCVDLFLPVVGDREIRVTAGIVSSVESDKGYAVNLHFMIADVTLRRQLNELVALLLSGDADAAQKQPRVIYDVNVRYGARGERVGHLDELSLTDLSMRTEERLSNATPVRLTIPAFGNAPSVVIEGTVRGQRLSREGGYHTSIAFDALDLPSRRALSGLVADLMCR